MKALAPRMLAVLYLMEMIITTLLVPMPVINRIVVKQSYISKDVLITVQARPAVLQSIIKMVARKNVLEM